MSDPTSDHTSGPAPEVSPQARQPESYAPDPNDTGAERRLHERETASALTPVIDFGFGPVDILDWSFGGARLKGVSLSLKVGEFATGTISMGSAKGNFIADVVRVHPPYFDPQHAPEEISLRWLDLPPGVLDQMVTATA